MGCTKIIYDLLPEKLFMGYGEEQLSRTLTFDISQMLAELPGGVPMIAYMRPRDELGYLASGVTLEGSTLTWELSAHVMQYKGIGGAQIVLVDESGEETHILKSHVMQMLIGSSIPLTGGEPPEPWETWLEQILAAAARAESAAADAEAQADRAETAEAGAQQALIDAGSPVLYGRAQTLTDAQQQTARGNIAAASAADVSDIKSAFDANDAFLYDNFGIEPIVNLFDKNTVVESKRIRTTDGVAENTGSGQYYASDFVPVVAGKQYFINFSYYSYGNYGMAFFDSNKTYLSGLKQGSSSALSYFSFTAPENCAFVRITVDTGIIAVDAVVLSDVEFNDDNQFFASRYMDALSNNAINSNGDIVSDNNFTMLRVNVADASKIKVTTYRLSGAAYHSIGFYSTTNPSAVSLISLHGKMTTTGALITEVIDVPTNAVLCCVCSRWTTLPRVYLLSTYKAEMDALYPKQTGTKNNYFGERIVLQNSFGCLRREASTVLAYTYSITNPTGNKLSGQGGDIYGNYLFRFHQNGYCRVYNIENLDNPVFVDDFEIPDYGNRVHANTVCFSTELATGNDFPYLYVTKLYDNTCYVLNVTTDSAVKVQEITIDSALTEFEATQFICGDDGYLYVTCSPAYQQSSSVVDMQFFKFNIPDTTQSQITLGQTDVIDSWVQPYNDYVLPIQGGKVKNGRLYLSFGTSRTDRKIIVYNVETHKQTSVINLTDLIPYELEDIAFFDNSIIVLVNGANGFWQIIFD